MERITNIERVKCPLCKKSIQRIYGKELANSTVCSICYMIAMLELLESENNTNTVKDYIEAKVIAEKLS